MYPDKGQNEQDVFRKFALKAGLAIDATSIKSLSPPQPDISCRINGVVHYVELTRMVHDDFANMIGNYLSAVERTGTDNALPIVWYSDTDALTGTIGRKAFKKYETGGVPLILLIYIDGVFHPPGMFSEQAGAVLERHGGNSPFSEIWLYDSFSASIVAHWERRP